MKIASTGMTPIGSCLGALGGQVADAALDGQVHLDRHVVRVEGHQHQLGVDDLDVGRLGDVGGGDRAGAALDQAELDRVRREALEAQLLDVEDDLGDVFLDAGDRAELVVDVADLDRRDGRALERGQQDAPERVAEGDAVAGLAAGWPRTWRTCRLLDGLDLRGLEFDHEGGLPRVVLDHELLVELERHLVAAGRAVTVPASLAASRLSQSGAWCDAQGLLGDLEVARGRGCVSRTSIRSPGLTW